MLEMVPGALTWLTSAEEKKIRSTGSSKSTVSTISSAARPGRFPRYTEPPRTAGAPGPVGAGGGGPNPPDEGTSAGGGTCDDSCVGSYKQLRRGGAARLAAEVAQPGLQARSRL